MGELTPPLKTFKLILNLSQISNTSVRVVEGDVACETRALARRCQQTISGKV